jgi:hypothetical protein|tara:strand:- start:146 stop:526 length:381 start_codon:yes stop_codon:yes gene_type:complete
MVVVLLVLLLVDLVDQVVVVEIQERVVLVDQMEIPVVLVIMVVVAAAVPVVPDLLEVDQTLVVLGELEQPYQLLSEILILLLVDLQTLDSLAAVEGELLMTQLHLEEMAAAVLVEEVQQQMAHQDL